MRADVPGVSRGGPPGAPVQGRFVELALPEPGHCPFVSHVMVHAERGAHGVLRVTR